MILLNCIHVCELTKRNSNILIKKNIIMAIHQVKPGLDIVFLFAIVQ